MYEAELYWIFVSARVCARCCSRWSYLRKKEALTLESRIYVNLRSPNDSSCSLTIRPYGLLRTPASGSRKAA